MPPHADWGHLDSGTLRLEPRLAPATSVAAGAPAPQARSNRSRFMTFTQAATKSWTNFSLASSSA